MTDKIIKPRIKRLPKGQRTHIRRLKQAARKEANIDNPQSSPARPLPVQKKDQV